MRGLIAGALLGTLTAGLSGCASDDAPPPPRAAIPPTGTYTVNVEPEAKPLPSPDPAFANRQPYSDEPIVTMPPPEQAAFVNTYNQVGRPRMTLFVNRTLAGQIVPTNVGSPTGGTQRVREATGAVKADVSAQQRDPWGRPTGDQTDRFETTGPATLTDRTETYLAPGEYDEVSARRVDYDAIESVLSDWIAANGRVALISPRLSEGQMRQLEQGKPGALSELSKSDQ
ncbi:MAG: hypothetical protein JWM57_2014, partial [Phycisphaerales bacterium]|nr:hypothetical protein [Phycisphaerales bacterium]